MRRSLKKRVERLEPRGNSVEGPEVVIRQSVVDENGEPVGVFSKLRVWEDEYGEWHSEKTECDLSED